MEIQLMEMQEPLWIVIQHQMFVVLFTTIEESDIIFINKADSKVSLKVSVMQDQIAFLVSISIDVTKKLWLLISID